MKKIIGYIKKKIKKENILDPQQQQIESNLVEDSRRDTTAPHDRDQADYYVEGIHEHIPDPLEHTQADYSVHVDELHDIDDDEKNYKSRGLK